MTKALLFWLAVLLVFVGGMTIWMGARTLRDGRQAAALGNKMAEPDSGEQRAAALASAADFVLTDQLGQPFSSASLRGKVWAGSIFFSRCPSICVEQNQKIALLDRRFRAQGLQLVSLTCDPAHDNPVRLREYSRRFNADPQNWHFLTGDMAEITRIGQGLFQVVVATETHSDRVTVFGRDGKPLGTHSATKPDGFARLVELLEGALAEDGAAAANEAGVGAEAEGAVKPLPAAESGAAGNVDAAAAQPPHEGAGS